MLPRIIRLRLAAQQHHVVSACTPRTARRAASYNAGAAWHLSQDDQHHQAETPPPPPLPLLSDATPGEALPNTSSFPLYPSHSSSQPVAGPSRTSREQHEADLALLRSYAKSSGQGHGKGKGKGRAYVPRTAADLPADEVLLGEAKKRMSARYSRDVAEYSEEELREFYFAMVQSGAEGGEVDAEERGGTRRISGGNEVRRIGSGALGSQRSWGRGWEGGMQGLEPRSGRIERLLQRALRRLSGTGDSSLLREGAAVPGAPGHAIQSLTAEQAGDAILAALKQALPDSSGSGSGEAANGVQVGLGLLRRTEWKGLLADRIQRADFYGLMQTLRYMEQCSFDVQFAPVLGDLLAYSIRLSFDEVKGGGSRAAEEMIDRLEALLAAQEPANFAAPDHHALISAYLRQPLSPSRAISHLSRFAALGLPAPQSAYALVLSCLTSSHPSAPRRALAWDLFADMRLTAHPTPSLEVYRTMISACASGAEPKPEMARDLWVEMNQHYSASGGAVHHASLGSDDEGGGEGQTRREEPGVEEFTAFIRALGSTKGTYLEAFEVMRQMLARHDEASYVPFDNATSSSEAGRDGESAQPQSRWTKWTPTRDTWKALLEGTKRAGDVERSKWVLLEAARWAEETREEMMDEDMVASVLMAYAAFVPKRTRVGVSIREQVSTSSVEIEGTGEDAPATLAEQGQAEHAQGADGNESTASAKFDSGPKEHAQMSPAHMDEQSQSAPLQATLTAAQAIAEARGIFELVRSRSAAGTAAGRTDSSTALMEEATYNAIRITPRLVNSFLSVIYAHSASIDTCRSEWSTVWSSLPSSAKPNGWSYLHALERCAVGQRHFAAAADAGAERQAALAWAKELWEGYRKSYPAVTPGQDTLSTPKELKAGTGPRQIERAWASIIRAHAIADELPAALALLLEFQRLYPPSLLVNLYNPRQKYPDLKIKFTDPTTVADPDVPPHLLWKDVDVLHHRMVRDGDAKGVGKVKMVTMGYLRALRERAGMRRREVVGGRKSRKDTCSRQGEEVRMGEEVSGIESAEGDVAGR